ncbi:hypothetical protein PIB30_080134, partial [Stylosanthes scabra]|nr:hypothetical protein [Stylosanthes scabra]
ATTRKSVTNLSVLPPGIPSNLDIFQGWELIGQLQYMNWRSLKYKFSWTHGQVKCIQKIKPISSTEVYIRIMQQPMVLIWKKIRATMGDKRRIPPIILF